MDVFYCIKYYLFCSIDKELWIFLLFIRIFFSTFATKPYKA